MFRSLAKYSLADLQQEKHIEPEMLILPDFLKGRNQPVCIDVGANRGDYIYILEKITPAGNIYAIEPVQSNVRHLRQLFRKVNVLDCALSDQDGESEIKIPVIKKQVYDTRATLEQYKEQGETDAIRQPVKLMTLDQLVDGLSLRQLDFVKIDVEGHEWKVLQGGKQTLETLQPRLLIEIEQRHHQFPITQIFDYLYQLNYQGYFYYPPAGEWMPLARFSQAEHQQAGNLRSSAYINNFFFLPPKDHAFEAYMKAAIQDLNARGTTK